jgi:hypothetical protein
MSAARLAGVDVFTRPHADRVIIRWNAEASAPFSVRSVVNADMPRSLLELLTRDRIGELTTRCTKGGCKLDGGRRMPGAGLSRLSPRKAPFGKPAFQPY